MESPEYSRHLQHMTAIREAAFKAADAAAIVSRNLHISGDQLMAGQHRFELRSGSRIFLVAFGKASPAMTHAAVKVLGDRLEIGIAAIPHGYEAAFPTHIRTFQAGHPLPDEGSLAAGQAVAKLLSNTTDQDLLICLISGGGSAMLEWSLPGVSLTDLRDLNELLLRSGAPIEAINIVRRTLSLIKAGGLSRMAAPALTISLILSDVVGDRLSSIASGPTVLRRPRPDAARSVLNRFEIWKRTPANIRAALNIPEPPRARARRPFNLLVGNNRLVVEAAARCAKSLGFKPRVITHQMRGEACEAGKRLAASLRRAKGSACLLMGGETTVAVHGTGRGGRNQELALSAAQALHGLSNVAVMALATDGIDGPTDAAGAVVTGDTVHQALSLGLNPETSIQENNAYPLLDALNALIRTGPSGSNLNDLVVGLTYKKD